MRRTKATEMFVVEKQIRIDDSIPHYETTTVDLQFTQAQERSYDEGDENTATVPELLSLAIEDVAVIHIMPVYYAGLDLVQEDGVTAVRSAAQKRNLTRAHDQQKNGVQRFMFLLTEKLLGKHLLIYILSWPRSLYRQRLLTPLQRTCSVRSSHR